MSKKLNTLTKFAMAAGVALFTTMAANLAPASAAKVNFSFTTEDNRLGSFDLDTSVADGNSDDAQGFYADAIQNFTFDGIVQDTRDLRTFKQTSTITRFSLFSFLIPEEIPSLIEDYFDFNDSTGQLINQLSSNPSVYNTSFAGGRYGSMNVTGLTASDPTAVPEPTTVVGSLVALGMGLRMKRKIKKGDLSA